MGGHGQSCGRCSKSFVEEKLRFLIEAAPDLLSEVIPEARVYRIKRV